MKEYIGELVFDLVNTYGERNPFELCKALNIEVMPFDFSNNYKGYITMMFGVKIIVISLSLSSSMKKIVCAHELGHALLHEDYLKDNGILADIGVFDLKGKPELEANLFASELLISDDDVLELLQDYDDYFSVAKMLRVPPQLLDFKIRMMIAKGHKLNSFYNYHGDFLKK